MKKVLCIILATAILAGCMDVSEPYPDGHVNTLTVTASYPEEYSSMVRKGVSVKAEEVSLGYVYVTETDGNGVATFRLRNGIYRISASDRSGSAIFNGSYEKLRISEEDVSLKMQMVYSKAGTLVIKEVYSGGCSKYPQEGSYQSDKYFIIHNNDSQVAYLDSLCFGTLFPWNSTSSNPWSNNQEYLQTTVPVGQAIWQFPGDGETFPLQPGEDAVIAINGAIDHTVQYPLSINLNFPDCFVCYEPKAFDNTLYHPAPGDRIREDHYLILVDKKGQSNANLLSINSPTVVIFRPEEKTIPEWVATEGFVTRVPGGTERVYQIPAEWIIDGMETFYGGSTSNTKRLSTKIDAGFVYFSETFKGRSLCRRKDDEASSEKGYEVLLDTNNSTVDFYERETQSLHK